MSKRDTKTVVVIGLGKTGKSCVRFLKSRRIPVMAMDTRLNPPDYQSLTAEFPDLKVLLGDLDANILLNASEIVLSPGVSMQHPALQQALQAGIAVISDISLFRRYVDKPVVAITGSNAKTTVTSLVGKLLQDHGLNVMVAGNIGIPVMELLNQGIDADVYVLELSSFQLETTRDLNAKVATILNISADHMDRYPDMQAYIQAKQYIYQGCEIAVVNKDDERTKPEYAVQQQWSFHENKPKADEFGLIDKDGQTWLAHGVNPIIRAADLKIKGRHNQLNALAAVAIARAMGVPMESIMMSLGEFSGLIHRCQSVASIQGVDWINDSKGTNVGATQAAIEGIGAEQRGKIILIAGGEGKGADFSLLAPTVKRYVKQLILIGRDAALIATALERSAPIANADSLLEAMKMADEKAEFGDAVLFSPACASFDMFRDYEDRGNQFMQLVQNMEATA